MILFQFVPPTTQPFFFNPTLAGQTYLAVVPWSLFGARWYIELSSPDGTLVFSKALAGSPDGKAIQSLSWANGYAVARTAAPHGYRVLDTVNLTVTGCAPAGYNGTVQALITKLDEFAYPLPSDLGEATTLGLVSYDINIVAGYVAGSSMVFRDSSQQFEVTP